MAKWFSKSRTAFAWIVALALFCAPVAIAQEVTGAIDGVVRDADGAVLPGATVQATGPVGNVIAVTGGNGEFRFPRLPSGKYTVTASLDGFATAEGAVDLTVGRTSTLEFTLSPSQIAETITVTGESVAIDLTSAQTATNISRERIDLIPRGRDFTDVVAQAAGAADESQAGGISIDGRPLPAGENGEVVLRGPNIFLEYDKDPEQTRAAFTAERASTSATARSGVSPMVRRRSKRKVKRSGTAQSLGVCSSAQLAVRVPWPRNGSSKKPWRASYACAASVRMAPAYSRGFSPSQGMDPWQERPVTSTSICMRPR